MAKKCARTFSIVVEKGKKSILDVRWLLPDALPRSVRWDESSRPPGSASTPPTEEEDSDCTLERGGLTRFRKH